MRIIRHLAPLAVGLAGSAIISAGSPASLSGAWRGEIKMGAVSLPLVFNFDTESDGTPHFTLDSPQQNVKGLPLTVNYLSADSISVAAANIGAVYCGRITGESIEGVFSQRGYDFPMTLTLPEPVEVRRPQTPCPPFPYQTVDTVFTSHDGVSISGTLVLPDNGTEAAPIVVMVTGSGPQNRDEEIFEHKPFAVIADNLACNGIASFRYDDRGVAQSGGDFASSTIQTFAGDCQSAVSFIREMNCFGSVGILGHSEGGTISMMLASRHVPDFIISLAGMSIPGKETILDQNRHSMEMTGLSARDIEGSMTLIEAVFDKFVTQEGDGGIQIDVDGMADSLNVTVPPMVMQSLKMNVAKARPQFRELLKVNAGSELKDIECPFLALNGNRDTQVDAAKNLGVIRANCRGAIVHEMEGLNHLFQHADSGELAEYSEIKETISPEVLDLIVKFIKQIR